MTNINEDIQMRCKRCGCTDLEIITEHSNVHNSWITGRIITTNRNVVKVVCKHCGSVYNINEVKNYTAEEKKQMNSQLLLYVILIIVIYLAIYFLIIKK